MNYPGKDIVFAGIAFLYIYILATCRRGCAKKSERTLKTFVTWEKEDKDGREIEHTRAAKLVSGDARVTGIAKKTKHICDFRFQTGFLTNRDPHKDPTSSSGRTHTGLNRELR